MSDLSAPQYHEQLELNAQRWARKPMLRRIYHEFYRMIAAELAPVAGLDVELGSGIGMVTQVIPGCVRTDVSMHARVDRAEDAYALSFAGGAVANLILFDVFHHLRYPGSALREFHRVLAPGGRVVIFEPCVSLLGRLVYGLLHPEPLALRAPIEWTAPGGTRPAPAYYAAQGNAYRVFVRRGFEDRLRGWHVRRVRRRAAITYVASGGYSGPQLFPLWAWPVLRAIDAVCDLLPSVFATRLLVVLEKADAPEPAP